MPRARRERARPAPLEVYEALLDSYGPQGWWPGETSFEVIVGALLTQQTSWTSVERAIANLRRAKLLSPERLAEAEPGSVEGHVRCTGFYRQKARAVLEMSRYIADEYGGSVSDLLAGSAEEKRAELLRLRGVGHETADSILLYVKGAPVFVVDAYTHRLFGRLGYALARDYETTRRWFERRLPKDARLYGEYHALIDVHCKTRCTREPECGGCALAGRCRRASGGAGAEANLIKH